MWLRFEGHEVYGAALLLNDEVFDACFNTQDLGGEFRKFANKRPTLPDVEGMSPEQEALTWLKYHEADPDWVEYHRHVIAISEEFTQRLKCEKVVSVRGTADKLVEKCGFDNILEVCVPWELESERAEAPPSEVVAAEPITKESPASNPPRLLQLPAIGLGSKPPVHPDSSVHLANIAGAVAEVAEETRDLFDGTEPVAPHEIVEVSEDDKQA
jgi:hypothetical protein